MMQDVTTSPLSYPHTDVELRNQCKVIYGGVSWPTKRPGFAVIVAMLYEKHFDTHDIYLLAEYESFDTRELVRQCGALDAQYKPSLWIGDNRNNAADRFINEMASELNRPADIERYRAERQRASQRSFYVCPTMMLEMNQLYSYVLPHLRNQLEPERRMLFLKASKLVDYLADIEDGQIAELQTGDFPSIEALAFAVIEIRNHYPAERPDEGWGDETNLAGSYGWQKTPFD